MCDSDEWCKVARKGVSVGFMSQSWQMVRDGRMMGLHGLLVEV